MTFRGLGPWAAAPIELKKHGIDNADRILRAGIAGPETQSPTPKTPEGLREALAELNQVDEGAAEEGYEPVPTQHALLVFQRGQKIGR